METNKLCSNPIKVGDIFHVGFGYSMTLNHFYQVVRVKSPTTIEVQKIGAVSVKGDGWSGEEAPQTILNNTSPILTKRLNNGSFKTDCGRAYLHEEGKTYYYNSMD